MIRDRVTKHNPFRYLGLGKRQHDWVEITYPSKPKWLRDIAPFSGEYTPLQDQHLLNNTFELDAETEQNFLREKYMQQGGVYGSSNYPGYEGYKKPRWTEDFTGLRQQSNATVRYPEDPFINPTPTVVTDPAGNAYTLGVANGPQAWDGGLILPNSTGPSTYLTDTYGDRADRLFEDWLNTKSYTVDKQNNVIETFDNGNKYNNISQWIVDPKRVKQEYEEYLKQVGAEDYIMDEEEWFNAYMSGGNPYDGESEKPEAVVAPGVAEVPPGAINLNFALNENLLTGVNQALPEDDDRIDEIEEAGPINEIPPHLNHDEQGYATVGIGFMDNNRDGGITSHSNQSKAYKNANLKASAEGNKVSQLHLSEGIREESKQHDMDPSNAARTPVPEGTTFQENKQSGHTTFFSQQEALGAEVVYPVGSTPPKEPGLKEGTTHGTAISPFEKTGELAEQKEDVQRDLFGESPEQEEEELPDYVQQVIDHIESDTQNISVTNLEALHAYYEKMNEDPRLKDNLDVYLRMLTSNSQNEIANGYTEGKFSQKMGKHMKEKLKKQGASQSLLTYYDSLMNNAEYFHPKQSREVKGLK